MPKRKPDQVITHRIELGTWERDNIAAPVAATKQVSNLAGSVSGIAAAGALGLAAYGLYWFFDSAFEIRGKIKDFWLGLYTDQGITEEQYNEYYNDPRMPTSMKIFTSILGIR